MVVVTLTDCPARLRGDITKWMPEIGTGVYVGNFSARVREELWERICDNIKTGRAIMIYSTQGEQKFDFYVHNSHWVPEDYDGVKLIRHLSKEIRGGDQEPETDRFRSTAAKLRLIKKRQMFGNTTMHLDNFIVLDFETTGLDENTDEIIEIGALKIKGGSVIGDFHRLVRSRKQIPADISKLTGLTDAEIGEKGVKLEDAIPELVSFFEDAPILCFNRVFEQSFLRVACKKCGLGEVDNRFIDVRNIAKKKLPGARNYKLSTLAEMLGVSSKQIHRALDDCYLTCEVFLKLNEMGHSDS